MTENSELSPALSKPLPKLPYLQFASILLNGLEKLAEIQKTALAIYAEIARDSVESAKTMVPFAPPHLFELAEQAIREFLQVQVRLLDLMLSQSAAHVDAVRANPDIDFEGEVARLMRDSTDSLLSMQKKAVEFMNEQNQALAAEMGDTTDPDTESLAQPDTAAIILAQKKFWDVTLKPFKALRVEAQFPGE